MRKIIAISVVFALVVGAAFAEVSVSASAVGSTLLLNYDGTDTTMFGGPGANGYDFTLQGEGEVGIGTIGGFLTVPGGSSGTRIKAWWQPIEQLKIQFGGDGEWDTSHIVRYSFNARANAIGGLTNTNIMWGGALAGTDSDKTIHPGLEDKGEVLLVSINPAEGFSANVAFRLRNGQEAADAFENTIFQVNYSAGFGTIHLTYDGNAKFGDNPRIYASAFLTVVEGLGIEVGGSYTLEGNEPIRAALGLDYGAGSFGVKFRSFFIIPDDDNDFATHIGVLPYYSLSDDVTLFGDIGLTMVDDGSDPTFYFTPYIRIGSTWGSGFYAGIKFDYDGSDLKVSVPVGIRAAF